MMEQINNRSIQDESGTIEEGIDFLKKFNGSIAVNFAQFGKIANQLFKSMNQMSKSTSDQQIKAATQEIISKKIIPQSQKHPQISKINQLKLKQQKVQIKKQFREYISNPQNFPSSPEEMFKIELYQQIKPKAQPTSSLKKDDKLLMVIQKKWNNLPEERKETYRQKYYEKRKKILGETATEIEQEQARQGVKIEEAGEQKQTNHIQLEHHEQPQKIQEERKLTEGQIETKLQNQEPSLEQLSEKPHEQQNQ